MEEKEFEILCRLVRANVVYTQARERYAETLMQRGMTTVSPDEFLKDMIQALCAGFRHGFAALFGIDTTTEKFVEENLGIVVRVASDLRIAVGFVPKVDLPSYFFPVLFGGFRQGIAALLSPIGDEMSGLVSRTFAILSDECENSGQRDDVSDASFCDVVNARFRADGTLKSFDIQVSIIGDKESYSFKTNNAVLQLILTQMDILYALHDALSMDRM